MACSEAAEKIVYNKISELLCSQTDWTDDQRVEVLSQYMKLFAANWKETLQCYGQQEQKTAEQKTSAEEVATTDVTEDSSDVKLDESVEAAAVTYEARLISTCRQRSGAPAKLAQLLGSSTRFALLAAKNQRVDLPLRPSIEWGHLNGLLPPAESPEAATAATSSLDVQLEQFSENVSQAVLEVQAETNRLRSLSTALDIVASNATHPTHQMLANRL